VTATGVLPRLKIVGEFSFHKKRVGRKELAIAILENVLKLSRLPFRDRNGDR
jgi:hypothetical protein